MNKYDDKYFQERFNKINYYKNLIVATSQFRQKPYLKEALEELCNELYIAIEFNKPTERKEFTLEELSIYDGRENRPAYVAISGTVYDVTSVEAWKSGMHAGLKAGTDLTKEYNECHTNIDLSSRLKVVGVLKK